MSQVLNFIVVLVAASLFLTLVSGDDAFAFKDACIAELHLDSSQYVNFHPNSIPVPSHDDKCLVKCMLEKRGLVSATGEPQVATFLAKIPAAANIDLNRCSAIKTDDVCETVFQMEKCVMDQLPNM